MATAVTRTGMSSHGTSNSGNNFQRSNLGFPVKLHACLTELERQGLSHIASFQPHGRSFLVHKQHEFVTQVLPKYVCKAGERESLSVDAACGLPQS